MGVCPPLSRGTPRWPRKASTAVSFTKRGQEMTPSSSVLCQIVVINAYCEISRKLGDLRETTFSLQDWEGCLEVASAAWLFLPLLDCVVNLAKNAPSMDVGEWSAGGVDTAGGVHHERSCRLGGLSVTISPTAHQCLLLQILWHKCLRRCWQCHC